jgi:predicted kinase
MDKSEKELIILIGPMGSGKSTYCQTQLKEYFRINQDDQGKDGHFKLYEKALRQQSKIVVDRINHLYNQRRDYICLARNNGFKVKFVEFKVSPLDCIKRIAQRKTHPTLTGKNLDQAIQALNMYFSFYQKPTDREYDEIEIIGDYNYYLLDLTKVCEGKRVIKIGDVHGCFDELQELLVKVNYKPGIDVLIFAGDLIDRGPKIREVLEFVRNTPLVFSVFSNHEYKLLRHLKGRPVTIRNGLQQTLDQCKDYLDPVFTAWLASLPLMIKWKEDNYVVHAGVHPWKQILEQERDFMIFARAFDPQTGNFAMTGDYFWYDFPRKEKIFFGHMPKENAKVADHATALDGGAVHGGVLRSCIDGNEIVEVKSKQTYSDEHYTESSKE